MRRAASIVTISAVLVGASVAQGADYDARDNATADVQPSAAQEREVQSLDAAAQFDPASGTAASLVGTDGSLTGTSNAAPEHVVRGFLEDHSDLFRLDAGDLASLRDEGEYRTAHNGVTQLSLQQTDDGRDVFGAIATFAVDDQGRLVSQNGALAPDAAAPAEPALGAVAAVRAAAAAVGAAASGDPTVRSAGSGPGQRTVIDNVWGGRLADPRPVEAELVTFPMPAGHADRLGWRIYLEVSDSEDYEMVVDAITGDVLYRRNSYANAAEGNVYTSQNPTTSQAITPFTGWVADRTTEGNNANAYEDLMATNAVGYRPQTPASGDPAFQHFDYPFTNAYETSGGTDLTTDQDATVTQLFYWVNFAHDYLYGLGFDEPSGNFQKDNFGKGGAGNDPVLAEAYNGYGTGTEKLCKDSSTPPKDILCRNNANMHTDPDGTSPRLQVYVGATPFPFRLSEMEGDTVVHEYSHGLSNRLVGDGTLGSGTQTGGMGEGWSDFMATSIFNDPVIFEYSGGTDGTKSGFRRVRYDTSTEKYSDLCKPKCEVHSDGEIWATALWAMRTQLIARDPANGKRRAEQLVVDGMKNTGTSPTFLTARDGILAADQTNNAGANTCLIWGVFAAREMGVSAASAADQNSVTAAKDGPASCTPIASAGGPYTTPEGSDKTLDASGSTNPGDGPLTYAWDLDNDGDYDDATGDKPSFTNVGRDGSFPIGVKVTNANGFSATATSSVTVDNVAPTAGAITTDGPKPENLNLTLSGGISDPGWEDPLSATINFGDGTGTLPLTGTEEHARPDGTIAYTAGHTYGDDGTFTITVCAADDDVSNQCTTRDVTITNVDPTAAIGLGGTTDVNGTPVILAHAGNPVAFSGRSLDVGSDDLTLRWDWDDGAPVVDVSTTYLANPPATDPDPSASIQPRDVTDARTHAFGQACTYHVGFSSLDDDTGSAASAVDVLITGNTATGLTSGVWAQQYRQKGGVRYDKPTLTCYLKIAGYVSKVFNEARDASTFPLAQEVLFAKTAPVTARDQLDRDLLTAWLNFANGAVEWNELVVTGVKKAPPVPFRVAMQTAEAVRLNPLSTAKQFDDQRKIIQKINQGI